MMRSVIGFPELPVVFLRAVVLAGLVIPSVRGEAPEEIRLAVRQSVNSGVTLRNWRYVVIHHSATAAGSVESIHDDHRRRTDRNGNNWLGIGYHFVIGNGAGMPDGQIQATFRWRQQIHGAHSGSTSHNLHGIGICLIGNFQQSPPGSEQQDALVRLVAALSDLCELPPESVIGHNAVRPTDCPGRFFPMQDVLRDSFPNLDLSRGSP